MIYEALVINTELSGYAAKRGDITVINPQGYAWSDYERSDRFSIIQIDLPSDEHKQVLANNGDYYYDFALSKSFEELETARAKTETKNNPNLGINTSENIRLKDKMG